MLYRESAETSDNWFSSFSNKQLDFTIYDDNTIFIKEAKEIFP